jgi:hypothetical protein
MKRIQIRFINYIDTKIIKLFHLIFFKKIAVSKSRREFFESSKRTIIFLFPRPVLILSLNFYIEIIYYICFNNHVYIRVKIYIDMENKEKNTKLDFVKSTDDSCIKEGSTNE